MNCPNILGLLVRCKPMIVLHANEIRVMLEDDSEIDLVLVNCFPPPRVRVVDGTTYEVAKGMEAYRAAINAIESAPQWLRMWLPVPEYAREWFRNLQPGSKQAGHLWISTTQTLNEYLVERGLAQREQPKPGSPWYDGANDTKPVEIPTSKVGNGRRVVPTGNNYDFDAQDE